jgi:hypothetical protein
MVVEKKRREGVVHNVLHPAGAEIVGVLGGSLPAEIDTESESVRPVGSVTVRIAV